MLAVVVAEILEATSIEYNSSHIKSIPFWNKGVKGMQYGSILRACRERKGWNQEEMAYQLMINQSDVSKFENNVKEPPMSMFQKWALVTGSQDVLVAFIAGMEGVSILSTILETMGSGVIGFIRLGGFM